MAILQPSDFSENPKYKIALTLQADCELEAMIDEVEEDVLQRLLGCELYDLFKADLSIDTPQTPLTQIYIDLFEKFCIDDSLCGIQRSKGMIDMLEAFVYFNWHRYNLNKSVSTGMVRGASENSNLISGDAFGIYDKYNHGVDTFRAIQQYISDNSLPYPTFNGQRLNYTSAL